MMARPAAQTDRTAIAGPAGAIEALIEVPEAHEGRHFGVVCHPHPLHGGTLENKVVHTVARAFVSLGAPTIRFNFRGVGASEGSYDDGAGETEDTLAVIEWGRRRWPDATLWIAGFSFGGAVAIRAAQRARPQRLIAISPAVTRLDVGSVTPSCPWLIVQGDADDVIAPQAVLEWAAGLSPAPAVRILQGAGHFFHGRLHDLRDAVLAFMSEPGL
jgi:alpha/beta superfamily hydrolase